MAYLVFDTETTGLPLERSRMSGMRFFDYKQTIKFDTSRIVSIAWIVLDDDFVEVSKYYQIIRPTFEIPQSSINIHGISQLKALEEGVEFEDMVKSLSDTLDEYPLIKVIIAHNIEFDINVLKSELFRNNHEDLIERLSTIKELCTMQAGKLVVQNVRFVRLAALYNACTNSVLENAHDALADTRGCAACFRHLALNHRVLL
jgi:DNA polymerase III epsilon subunit-like protein